MALADLRARALAYGAGTRGTRDAGGTRSGFDGEQTEEIRAFQGAGTRGTRGTREIGDAGRDETPAPANERAEALTLARASRMDARPALEPVNAEGEPIPAPSLDALVERLAVAMAVPRPWQRVTGPAGLAYMRQQARRRLATLAGNPQARGLLVQAEEAEARRWAPTEQQGDDHV